MLDCQEEIASDFSVFHGIRGRKLEELPSSRYFQWAELLPAYSGAVRAHLQTLLADEPSRAVHAEPVTPSSPAEEVHRIQDVHELVALTNQNGFAGFEYAGG